MRNLNYILIGFLIVASVSFAQPSKTYPTNPDRNRANVWYFGQNAGVSFNTNPPTALTDGKVNTIEGCASMCDTAGNLLFYTDGDSIWDGNHILISGEIGLEMQKSATQGALIIPHPGRDSLFYIFIIGYAELRYSLLNMNSRNLLIKKKKLTAYPHLTEQLTSTKHLNGRDFWVTYRGDNDTIFNYLITENGLIEKPYISKSIVNDHVGVAGFMKFSTDGKQLAINNIFYPSSPQMDIEIANFNSENAALSENKLIDNITYPYGLEFSSNNNYLYVTERLGKLVQFNLKSSDIKQSKRNIADLSQYNQIVGLQKGPDDKVYMTGHDSTFLGVINNPNDSGNTCNFNKRGLYLGGKKSEWGSPNFIQSIFYTPSIDFTYHYDCVNNQIKFKGLDTFGANIYSWKFKKIYGSSTPINSSLKNPIVNFLDTGLFQIIYKATLSGRTDSIIKTITIVPKVSKKFLGNDTAFCKKAFSMKLNAIKGMHAYNWNTGSEDSFIQTDSFGSYSVIVTIKSLCQVMDTITISALTVPEKPILTQGHDTLYSSVTSADSFKWYRNGERVYFNKSFLEIGSLGNYRLEVSLGDCGISSDVLNVTEIIGINSVHFNNLRIYPNPATDQITISGSDITQIDVLEISGKTIIPSLPVDSGMIDISVLQPGFYIIRLTHSSGHTTERTLLIQ